MNISPKGLIEIMSLEGVCLDPYLDSVGVWTIGVGITKYDGKDPQTMGHISIDQAIQMFKDRIGAYTHEVDRLGLDLTQNQYDALSSFCYNCGAGNLRKLASGRSVNAIGTALMLYTKPPEITARRQKEQTLYQYGKYSNNGKVLVFPVSASHHPVYSKGQMVDVSHYFTGEPAKPQQTLIHAKPTPPPKPPAPDEKAPQSVLEGVVEWLKEH